MHIAPGAWLMAIDLGGRTTAKTAVATARLAKENALEDIQLTDTQAVAHLTNALDANLVSWIVHQQPTVLALDCPLSLPDTGQPDYLYRPGDRAAGALSPWSMGEVTARGLHLAQQVRLRLPDCQIIEVYPKSVVQHMGLKPRGYKATAEARAHTWQTLCQWYPWQWPPLPATADDLDALLALAAAWHYASGRWVNLASALGQPPFVRPD